MLDCKDIRSGYGHLPVLHGIDLTVDTGEVVAVLGRNGVGKTTLLKTLAGALALRSGAIRLGDQDVSAFVAHRRARSGIAHVPQGRGIFGRLTVEENMTVGTRAAGSRARKDVFDDIFSFFPVLRERRREPAGNFSGGQQQQLAIARALCGEPKVLLLDEPSEGIQPNIVHEIGELIPRLARQYGIAVLLVEQNLDLVSHAATRCLFMDKGRVVHSVPTSELGDEALLKSLLAL
ncbi:ABC transporter ATP-binding protein [Rhizobium sp. A37_96]